jgi:indolepyruvate ferredoxin oxidoreductase
LMEGKTLLNLDQTGLAQKGGAVLSNLIIADGDTVTTNKVGMGRADLYLVLDALGGVLPSNLDRAHAERTAAVVNTTPNPTGEMIRDNTILFPSEASLQRSIDQCTRQDRNVYVDAGGIAEGLFGDHMTTNLFLLGVAYQAGLLPLQAESIESAIELNGVAVQQNQQAFRYGRRYAHDPEAVTALALPREHGVTEERAIMVDYLTEAFSASEAQAYEALLATCSHLDQESQRLLAIRIGELIAFQNEAYAKSYVDFILRVAARETAAHAGSPALTHAVIRNLYKLMAYKDEYEVARLHLKHTWREYLNSMFERPLKVSYNLHPPLLRALGMKRKLKLGPWFDKPMRLLTKMKRLRGTKLDVFGYAEVRREERALIGWYREAIELVIERLNDANRELSLQIATLPDSIRGYEDIKIARVKAARESMKAHLDQLTSPAYNNALPILPSADITV